ncbi:MAG: NAD(P)H-hydrate epimerase, partial [Deltaproteobacteria bacterium]|nr:NAD(P)H-hydrate epimerase [Deltaproteobacteria bacterium]
MADPRSDPRPDPAATLPLSLATRLASTADMRHMDAHAIETLGLPARLLMENAAQAVAAVVQSRLAECALRGPVVVCCGTGNNGGDGYAVARLLANAGVDTRVIALGALQGGDAAANALAWERFGAVLPWSGTPEKARHTLTQAAVLVDALFGTGLTREITGAAAELVTAFNAAPAPFKVAVDLPSGVSGDTGAVLGVAARCTDTVTFQVGKLGAYLHPGAGYAGRIHVAPISIAEHWTPSAPRNYLLTEAFAAALLPHRPADGHKGTFGHLLALCGSAGMGGAALLAGRGALRTGVGLITLGVPRTLRDAFVCQTPELMTLSAPEGDGDTLDDAQAPFFLKEAATRNAVALGCGLGRTPGTAAFVRKVTGALTQPLVLDADGLFALSQESLRTRPGPTIIT